MTGRCSIYLGPSSGIHRNSLGGVAITVNLDELSQGGKAQVALEQ